MRKTLIILGVLLIIFIAFCFKIGYKLPQRDFHKDWPLLDENTDPNYSIEPITRFNTAVKLGSSGLLMLINLKELVLIDSNGTLLRKFEASDDIYIDGLNNRLITRNYIRKDGVPTEYYVEFNLKDFSKHPVDLVDYPLAENFVDFAQLKGQTLAYGDSITHRDSINNSLLASQYKAAHIKDVVLFGTLQPIVRLTDIGGGPIGLRYFANGKGKFYHIRPLIDTLGYSSFHESMQVLGPALFNTPDIELDQRHRSNFHIADRPTIAGNSFQFDSGINIGHPTGGSSHPMSMYFNQNYLFYFSVNIKDSTYHFKISDKIPTLYVQAEVTSFRQLNTPRSDKDTLAFTYNGTLYKFYQRNLPK